MHKANELIKLMGRSMAKRFVIAKIAHWEFDEFIPVRTESKAYWDEVLYYIEN